MTESMVRIRGGTFLMGSDRTPPGGRARSKDHYGPPEEHYRIATAALTVGD